MCCFGKTNNLVKKKKRWSKDLEDHGFVFGKTNNFVEKKKWGVWKIMNGPNHGRRESKGSELGPVSSALDPLRL